MSKKIRVNAKNPARNELQVGILEGKTIRFANGKRIRAKKGEYKKV